MEGSACWSAGLQGLREGDWVKSEVSAVRLTLTANLNRPVLLLLKQKFCAGSLFYNGFCGIMSMGSYDTRFKYHTITPLLGYGTMPFIQSRRRDFTYDRTR